MVFALGCNKTRRVNLFIFKAYNQWNVLHWLVIHNLNILGLGQNKTNILSWNNLKLARCLCRQMRVLWWWDVFFYALTLLEPCVYPPLRSWLLYAQYTQKLGLKIERIMFKNVMKHLFDTDKVLTSSISIEGY